jgi:predicted metalloprotease with PDZ domain
MAGGRRCCAVEDRVKGERVHYRLSWESPNQHLFDVEIAFRARRRETALHLPAWRPGRYLIQNYAANVRQWWATGEDGEPLVIMKTDKSSWVVESKAGEQLRVGYRFFAGVLDAGSSYLDESEAYFNGSNLFMMLGDRRGEECVLEMRVPNGWKVETQLKRLGPNRWLARDYDYLIDAPTIASPSLVEYSFKENGTEIILAFQGAAGVDVRQYVAPAKKIVRAQSELFGGIPTKRYVFLYHVASLWHGVEHEDSCSIALRRSELIGTKPGEEAYDHTLAITSHELFHLWNVKRIMPARFVPYDYSRETPTKLLWAMEGITSYFGERTLLRSGLWTGQKYLDYLAKEISVLESIPGRHFLSLAQAGFDAWLQDPAQMHDRSNAWISFYNKGEIVSALLDVEIRRATKGRRSLDDVMRDLWSRYGRRGKGLEEDAIANALDRLRRPEVLDLYFRCVESTEPLPYAEVFGAAGIDFTLAPAEAEAPMLGMKVSANGGRLVVASVRSDGEAMNAGILAGDEILAVNDGRVTTESAFKGAVRAAAKKGVRLLFARNDVVRTERLQMGGGGAVEVRMAIRPERSHAEEKLLRSWLGESI